MIHRTLTVLAAAALLATPVASAAQDYPSRPALGPTKPFTVPASETYTLPNGMQVTLIPYGLAPKAFVNLRVYAGNLNEGEEVWLPDLMSGMMREGAAGRPGAEIASAAAAMGGNLGIGLDQHETAFSLNVLSEHTDDAVRLIGDVARRPNFPATEFDRVRQGLVRNLAVSKSQAQTTADAALAAAYFGNSHPYGRLFPTEAQLNGYTLEDVRRFYSNNFGAKRARLFVAGRFDRDAVRAAIEQAFSDWEAGPERLSLPAQPQPGPRLILVDRPGAPQSTIRLAFPAPAAGSAEDIPFRVTDALIGGSFTSRLTKNLREEKGYTYGPGSSVDFDPGLGSWVFDADVTTEVTGAALSETFKEIRRLQTEAPAAQEAAGIRTWLAGIFILQNASNTGLVNSLATRDFHGLPTNWLDAYVPAVLAVQPGDLQRLARERMPLERATLVVVGDLAKVTPQLRALPELRNIRFETVKPF